MGRKDIRRGLNYEKRRAKVHNARHVGGPGHHDYQRGSVKGEVKCRMSKVTKPELKELIRSKGVSEIDSKAGFTQPAINYRNKYQPHIRLRSRGRRI